MRDCIIKIQLNRLCLIAASFFFSLLISIGMTALPSRAYQNNLRFNYLPKDISKNYNRGELTDFSNLSNRSARAADLNYGPPLTSPSPGFYPPTSYPIRPFGLYGTGGGLPFDGGYGFGRPPLLPPVAYAPLWEALEGCMVLAHPV